VRSGTRVAGLLAAGIASAVILAACDTASAPPTVEATQSTRAQGESPDSQGPDSASTAAEPAEAVDAAGIAEHIHNLAVVDGVLYLGTHEGLFRQLPGQTLEQVSSERFDVMGLTRGGAEWLASGHPGAGMDAPPNLGLMSSPDGVNWEPRSLYGQVDFHRLAASGQTIVGLSAHDGAFLRSDDAGKTWQDLGTPPLFDLAVSPTDATTVVGTTGDGPVASTDGGSTFTPIDGAPLLAFLAWSDNALYAVDPTGQVHTSTDGGRTWTARGSVPGQPAALAAEGDDVALLVDGAVQYSTDGGRTFTPRLTGLGGH
jgi:photosystem II stability/assembly factor-like uncharacterized protein